MKNKMMFTWFRGGDYGRTFVVLDKLVPEKTCIWGRGSVDGDKPCCNRSVRKRRAPGCTPSSDQPKYSRKKP